jgi:hypothetical protein
MKALVMTLIILGAVAGGCAGNSMHSRPYPSNASSSDCQAAGGATYDALTGVCIGGRR